MKFLSRLAKDSGGPAGSGHRAADSVAYESVLRIESRCLPGVAYEIAKVSFGRRMELSRMVRQLSQKVEFLEAGNQIQEKIEAGILAQDVNAMYLRWGLIRIHGLTIDGEPPTPERLIESGPEELAREIVGAIQHECGLNGDERKN